MKETIIVTEEHEVLMREFIFGEREEHARYRQIDNLESWIRLRAKHATDAEYRAALECAMEIIKSEGQDL
jgi:hypothetical protein